MLGERLEERIPGFEPRNGIQRRTLRSLVASKEILAKLKHKWTTTRFPGIQRDGSVSLCCAPWGIRRERIDSIGLLSHNGRDSIILEVQKAQKMEGNNAEIMFERENVGEKKPRNEAE